MINRKKMVSLLLVLTLCSGMVVNGYASEIDDTKKKAEELENKKKTAENEKASLAEQLKQLTQEMENTKKKITEKEDEITTKEEELVQAKIDEDDQYNSMKKRIRYMYENGNTGFVEILCSSKSIGEFLNNAEIYQHDIGIRQRHAGRIPESSKECRGTGSISEKGI